MIQMTTGQTRWKLIPKEEARGKQVGMDATTLTS